MEIKGWKYYNHAAVPSVSPHEEPDLTPVENRNIWNITGKSTPLLARWTTEFDCGYETNWWYVIKDTPFDISALKAKRRYEVNKGKKNFEVKEIVAIQFAEKLFEVTLDAYSGWPEKYRPDIEKDGFIESVKKKYWDAKHNCSAYIIGRDPKSANMYISYSDGMTKMMLDSVVFTLFSYVLIFVGISFILTCSLMLFLSGSNISEDFVRQRAPTTFTNIFVLSFMFTVVTMLIKYYFFDKPLKNLHDGMENLLKGNKTKKSKVSVEDLDLMSGAEFENLKSDKSYKFIILQNGTAEIKTEKKMIKKLKPFNHFYFKRIHIFLKI